MSRSSAWSCEKGVVWLGELTHGSKVGGEGLTLSVPGIEMTHNNEPLISGLPPSSCSCSPVSTPRIEPPNTYALESCPVWLLPVMGEQQQGVKTLGSLPGGKS